MSRESIELGPVPTNEECQQVGTPNYNPFKARQEVDIYIRQLKRLWNAVKGEPLKVKLIPKYNLHEFGTYYEAAVSFNEDKENEVEAAFWFEENTPANWDQEALVEIEKLNKDFGEK